tara:strand:- start:451 stop:735 length:285 start_codon:yes stop_codon:yes gene_type:complete
MKTQFEILGYDFEVYYRGKYYGSLRMQNPDREIMGYSGRQDVALSEDWNYKKKHLKKGTIVSTECVPLCGKLLGSFKDKMNILETSKVIYNYPI